MIVVGAVVGILGIVLVKVLRARFASPEEIDAIRQHREQMDALRRATDKTHPLR